MSYICPEEQTARQEKIRKCSDRTRVGINLGYSSKHTLHVSLILNLQTGLVSPQYHCIYNDTRTQARSIPTSQWQFKAGLTSEKPSSEKIYIMNEKL
jgi:hypothetical protein